MVKGVSGYELNPTSIRETILQCRISKLKVHECQRKYHIHAFKIRLAIEEINY